jgi:outer membrane protein assembly factor BamB
MPAGLDGSSASQNSIYLSLQGNVAALAVNDGSQWWQRQISTGPAIINTTGDGVGYSEIANGGLVFFHTSDGSVLWQFPAQSTLDLRVEDIVNGIVYVSGNDNGSHAAQDTFYALSAADGSVRWTYAVGGRFDVIVG